MSSTQHEAELILRLYELRRDETMRRARAWYLTEFNPNSANDVARLMLSGFQSSAYYRMITSYWDMAASFVINGAIDEKMFLDANTEHVAIFSKIEPYIAEVREMFSESNYLINLEQVVAKIPDAKELLAKRSKLLAKWNEKHREANVD